MATPQSILFHNLQPTLVAVESLKAFPTNIRWDIDIVYGWSADAGNFWTDTEQLKYAIRKTGIAPGEAKYDIILTYSAGAPAVEGWGNTEFRSTNNMVRQALGSTIEHSGLGANTAYWRQ